MSDWTPEEAKKRLAIHEAGHAVFAGALDAGLGDVYIGTGGGRAMAAWPEGTPEVVRQAHNLAGNLAELLVLGKVPPYPEPALVAAWLRATSCKGKPERAVEGALMAMCGVTFALLVPNRPAIERLAEELCARKRLTGAETAAILGAVPLKWSDPQEIAGKIEEWAGQAIEAATAGAYMKPLDCCRACRGCSHGWKPTPKNARAVFALAIYPTPKPNAPKELQAPGGEA